MVGVRKDGLQKKCDHLGLGGLRVAGKIIINSNENMLSTYYVLQNVEDAAWNETSHPKSVHVYLLSHQTIPAIQSNNDIMPTGHPQHTVKPHCHSVSVSVIIFHTSQRATGSSSLVVYSKQYRISV